jgi:cytochrome c-type biogenesis protein CcmF
MTIPGLRSTLADDLYVILVDWEPVSTQSATFKVYHNPLVKWLWIGSLVFMLGLFISLLPERQTAPVAAMAGSPAPGK